MRAVNSVSVGDAFPTEDVEDIVPWMATKSWYSLWYSNLAGARQGRGGCEIVRKHEGLNKDPREEGCLYLRKKVTR
jgi:hypothetical protein